ncbi:hypothetical protein A8F94_16370 [Bacillus sp. FJAT-27225]|uniref:BsuPI-related putative proteinase inhibitor n=1 Tax=Bacillus sp. FJAT-27225 TaxID=1743144 RepID=UPI00080C35C8|nr:BsuPI-related putative proteinase inhibitor [Bacillus sp. FJAT-27225]OCA84286.1 hypothetical protein A8F94_16370 [Bacillus sp. FJAT-27225]
MNLLIAAWLLLSFWLPVTQNQGNPGQGISVAIQAEPGTEAAQLTITITNATNAPVKLEFPTSEFYEVVVLDNSGSEVYSSSKGKAFLQAFQYITIPPGGSKQWKEAWNYSADGIRVPAGLYKATVNVKAVKLSGKPVDPQGMEASIDIKVPGKERDSRSEAPGENTVFHEINVTGSNGSYTVTGKARPRTGEFFYTVEDGHNQLIKEMKVVSGSKYPDWAEFELKLTIPAKQLPKNGTLILNLYEKTAGGSITGEPVAIVLQQFRGTN